MENENTPNINKLLRSVDGILGTGLSISGLIFIVLILMWPVLFIITKIGELFFGLKGP